MPFVLMTYLNPVLAFGKEIHRELYRSRCRRHHRSDLPYEEQNIIAPLLREANIALIPLVTVTSPIERIEKSRVNQKGSFMLLQ